MAYMVVNNIGENIKNRRKTVYQKPTRGIGGPRKRQNDKFLVGVD